jgi:hypothetical protein
MRSAKESSRSAPGRLRVDHTAGSLRDSVVPSLFLTRSLLGLGAAAVRTAAARSPGASRLSYVVGVAEQALRELLHSVWV